MAVNIADDDAHAGDEPADEPYDDDVDALRDLVMSSLAEAQFNQYDVLHKRLLEADADRIGVLDAQEVVDAVVEVGLVFVQCAVGARRD